MAKAPRSSRAALTRGPAPHRATGKTSAAKPPPKAEDRSSSSRLSGSHLSRASRQPASDAPGEILDLADWMTLGVLLLAPLVAGRFESVPAHALSGVIALAGFLALARPSCPPVALPAPLMLLGAALLGAAATLSVTVSVARGPSLAALANWLAWLVLFGLTLRLGRTRAGRRRALFAIALAAFLVGAMSLSEYLRAVREMAGGSIWRTFGPFAGPNVLASFLAMSLPLLLATFLSARNRGWAAALGTVVVLGLAVLPLTGSRGGLLATAGGLLALAVVAAARREWPDRQAWTRLGMVLAVGLPLFVLLSGPIAGRLLAPRTTATADASATAAAQAHSNQFRRLTWKSTARMAAANPLLGTGVGSFKYAHPRYAEAGFTEMAHQSYLQIAAETGLAGLLGLLLVLVGAAAAVLRAPPGTGGERWLAAGLGGGIAASAAHNLIDYSWYVYGTAALFWGLLGLAAALAPPWKDAAAGPVGRRARVPRAAAGVFLLFLLVGNLLLEMAAARAAAGEAAREAGKVDEAIAAYHAAAALFPLDPAARLALGDLKLARGDAEAALEAYRAAVRLAPTRSVHQYRLGRALVRLGRPREAIAVFEDGLKWDPNSMELLTELASVRQALGDREAALAIYRRVLAVYESPVGQVTALEGLRDYRPAVAMEALGDAADVEGKQTEALSLYERAADLLRRRRVEMRWMIPVLKETHRWRPEEEAGLREREARLWERIADLHERAGQPEKASVARQRATEALADSP